MEHANEKTEGKMTPEDVEALLSRTLSDVADRKVTVRYALAVSRLGLALVKTIETVELKDRVALLEQVLKTRKKK